LWFPSLNVMRQAVALSFCFFAIHGYLNRRYMLFFVMTLLGAMFHASAFFILIAGFLSLINLGFSIKTRVFPFIFVGFICFSYLAVHVVLPYVEYFLNFMGMERYAKYFSSESHFVERDYGSGLGVLAKLLFSIYIILKAKELISENSQAWLLVVLVFVYAVAVVFSSSVVVFGRMADTFVVAFIWAAYYIHINGRGLFNKVAVLALMFFLIGTFVKASIGAETVY